MESKIYENTDVHIIRIRLCKIREGRNKYKYAYFNTVQKSKKKKLMKMKDNYFKIYKLVPKKKQIKIFSKNNDNANSKFSDIILL